MKKYTFVMAKIKTKKIFLAFKCEYIFYSQTTIKILRHCLIVGQKKIRVTPTNTGNTTVFPDFFVSPTC